MNDEISAQMPMILRPLSISDETQVRQAHWEFAQDAFDFLLDLRRGEPWPAYLARLEQLRRGLDPPQGWVPATFLVAEVGNQVVGRVSIRHHLNPYLADVAGHIGIGVRPDFRRRGYARAILRQSLSVARATGLVHVLVSCDADNVGAISATLDCGGVLESVTAGRLAGRKCRFWVETCTPSTRQRTPGSRTDVAHRPPSGRSGTTPPKSVADRVGHPDSHSDSDSAIPLTPRRHRSANNEGDPRLEQQVSLVTLGVADVNRSRKFYERLGWQGGHVDDTVFVKVGAVVLVLSGRDTLALDCGLHDEQAGGFSGVVLSHSVRSETEVEDIVSSAELAGATVTRPAAPTSDGGYAAIFTDPDGHAWQVVHNPGLTVAEDGSADRTPAQGPPLHLAHGG